MNSNAAGPDPAAENLRTWLADRIALYLERDPQDLDHARPLAEFGMDSVAALSLCGDLEDEKGLVVETTLVWDQPTIDDLVRHLTPLLAAAGTDPGHS